MAMPLHQTRGIRAPILGVAVRPFGGGSRLRSDSGEGIVRRESRLGGFGDPWSESEAVNCIANAVEDFASSRAGARQKGGGGQ